MIDAKLETILDKDAEDIKIEDLIYMAQVLREDRPLVEYHKQRRVVLEGDKPVIDGATEIASAIAELFPEYDSGNLEAIQNYLQDNTSLVYLLVKPAGRNQEDYSIRGSMIRKLWEAGIQFTMNFEVIPQENDHYPVVLLELDHFFLRI